MLDLLELRHALVVLDPSRFQLGELASLRQIYLAAQHHFGVFDDGLDQTDDVQGIRRRLPIEPLDCIGGVINDLTAAANGHVYFTMGRVFHVAPDGTVTRYGDNLTTNGIVLSPDEKTLYMTNAGSVAAFDVQANGALANQREFVKLPTPGGDGLAVDSQNRLYVTAGPNLHVVAPDGKVLGSIPAPYNLITAAFAGPEKKTMYAVVSLTDPNRLQHAYVYSIPMIAQGYMGRAK